MEGDGAAVMSLAPHGCDYSLRQGRLEGARDERIRIAAWLRGEARSIIQRIQPADAREAEDCYVVETTMLEIAYSIENGEYGHEKD